MPSATRRRARRGSSLGDVIALGNEVVRARRAVREADAALAAAPRDARERDRLIREQHEARHALIRALVLQSRGTAALAESLVRGLAEARIGFDRLDVLIAHLTPSDPMEAA